MCLKVVTSTVKSITPPNVALKRSVVRVTSGVVAVSEPDWRILSAIHLRDNVETVSRVGIGWKESGLCGLKREFSSPKAFS